MKLLGDGESRLDRGIIPFIRQSLGSVPEFVVLATGTSFSLHGGPQCMRCSAPQFLGCLQFITGLKLSV